MEIIHLILGKANPERMNGVNKVVHQLATRQAMTGRSVAVWGITHSMEHDYGERNFETQLFKAQKNPFFLDPSLKRALLEKRDEITVHLHGGWVPTYYSVAAFLSKHGIPYVITPHGAYNSIARKRSSFRKRIYFQLFESKLLNKARRIHSIGESEVEGLAEIFPNSKSFLLPYGFSIKGRPNIESSHTDFVVGYIGRLDIHTKGLDLLMEAFSGLLMVEPQAKLWIVGDGNGRDQLESMLTSMGLEGSVILWGGKFGQEKDEILCSMDVFVHPSRNEGLPSAVLEAASFNIPCIVSRATNVASLIKEYNAGISIGNDSADELRQALIEMASQWRLDSIVSMRKQAARMVEEAFDWDTIVEKFDQLYQS